MVETDVRLSDTATVSNRPHCGRSSGSVPTAAKADQESSANFFPDACSSADAAVHPQAPICQFGIAKRTLGFVYESCSDSAIGASTPEPRTAEKHGFPTGNADNGSQFVLNAILGFPYGN